MRAINDTEASSDGMTATIRCTTTSPVSAFGIAPNKLTPCQQAVLNYVNKQFGTNGTAANVLPSSNPLPAAGGEVNVDFNFDSLTAEQFNVIQPGRYAPSGFWGTVTGYGLVFMSLMGPTVSIQRRSNSPIQMLAAITRPRLQLI